jgi:hypothetical protein
MYKRGWRWDFDRHRIGEAISDEQEMIILYTVKGFNEGK